MLPVGLWLGTNAGMWAQMFHLDQRLTPCSRSSLTDRTRFTGSRPTQSCYGSHTVLRPWHTLPHLTLLTIITDPHYTDGEVEA